MMQKLNSKAILSAVLALAVSSLFCFSSLTSYASNNAAEPPTADSAARGFTKSPAGVLTGTGTLSLNGMSTEPGATVFSGSIITTGHDGIASIDLGPVGRFIVRPRTTVTVTLSAGTAMISGRAKATRVNVVRGELLVSSPGANRLLKSGEDAIFADSIQASMSGDTVFTIQDQGAQKDSGQKDPGAQPDPNTPGQNPTPTPSPSPKKKTAVMVPWWGWAGLAAAAGGIAAGMATHGAEQPSLNRVSSTLP
jgi:hypothetical protein